MGRSVQCRSLEHSRPGCPRGGGVPTKVGTYQSNSESRTYS